MVQFTPPAELFAGAARSSPAQVENWGFLLGSCAKDGTLDRLHEQLRGDLRAAAGRPRQPSAAILVSQAVRTTEQGALRL